jgi:probable rRNA maturation factor
VKDAGTVVVAGSGRLPVATVRKAVATVLLGERRHADLSVTFVGAATMQVLNRDFKQHNRPTDVIAFALPQPDGTLTGDVYICRAVAARESRARRIPVREELLRLVVHATLHVLGHDHPEGPARERSDMWLRQERYLRDLA